MKTKAKRIWMAFAILIALAVAGGLLWRKQSPPQIITLSSGERCQFIAAEWGTNWVQPTPTARFIACLPSSVGGYVYRKWGGRLGIVTPIPGLFWGIGPMQPPEPNLRFWFRSLSTNTFNGPDQIKFVLVDQNGAAGGPGISSRASFGQGTDKWLTFAFPVLPRRSKMLQLLVFEAEGHFGGAFTQIGTVHFRNPLYGHFPDWQAESLPVTKTNGDLTVRLTDIRIGSRNLGGGDTHFHPPKTGDQHEIVFKLDIQSPGGTNEDWEIQPAELSDATGNRSQTAWCSRLFDTDEYHFGPALWPDEAAWRLRLTMKRSRAHDPGEIVTFTHFPVPAIGATNTVFQTNVIHGVPVVLKQQFIRQPDRMMMGLQSELETRFIAELVNAPEGFVVDYQELKADTGWTTRQSSSRRTSNSSTVFLDSVPADVRKLNISWVVQKTRTVEFLVKPPKSE